MSAPATFVWLARHELRLAWRDWIGLMTGGRPRRLKLVAAALIGFILFLHLVAYSILHTAGAPMSPDTATLIVVTGSALLSWSLMLSQAIEMVTRAFYARADLDLILSSPVSARRVFAVRIVAIAFSATFMALPMAAPFVNVLVYFDGPRWLGAYGVLLAMGAAATALSVGLACFLFGTLGPRRTRFIAQVVAAIVGAAFVIGVQAAAILSTGTLSRIAALQSPAVLAVAPGPHSPLWWPARAIMGDAAALLCVVGVAAAMLAAAIAALSMRFADYATAAAGVSAERVRQERPARGFRAATPAQILRRKEWLLLRRDPWLVSQTLIQILYLLPPALLLWRNFSEGSGALVVLVPVIVMAAGQLAGGLAWLAVSGEDAPDLVTSAPVPPQSILRAKVEAVLGCIALVVSPMVFVLLLASPFDAFVCIAGVLVAAASATMIQLWFRTQAKRTHFRRRQTSSRMATFAEAFSSIAWAATAFLLAAQTWLALIPGAAAIGVLAGSRAIRPR